MDCLHRNQLKLRSRHARHIRTLTSMSLSIKYGCYVQDRLWLTTTYDTLPILS